VLAFSLAAAGKSLREIARALNEQGYRTVGNQRRGVFTKDTVRDMLQNRFYLGELPVFEPGTHRRVRAWEQGCHEPLIDEATFTVARQAIEGRAASAGAARRGATVYSLSGLLRCVHCGERMRVLHNVRGRIRYYCRSKAQGLGCSGKGSYLDVYEAQVVADLAHFQLPDQWQQAIVDQAAADRSSEEHGDSQRQLRARLERLKELYAWGDLTREQYQTERDAVERELARLTPPADRSAELSRLAAYVASLPAAWADAEPAQRNALATLIYDEVWVDGPVVEFVKPRPEVEPLFQARTGAAQPVIGPKREQRPDGALSHQEREKWQGRRRWASGSPVPLLAPI
jgi:site-specific DNA recombinase